MTFLEEAKALYRSINVKPAITASGSTTAYGGTKLRPEVMDAMNKAASVMVDMKELNLAAGRIIADLTGADAGLVTGGAASGMTLQAAACIAGSDPGKMNQLPDTQNLKNEILVHKSQRFLYDQCYRAAGAKLVDFGEGRRCSPWEFESAFSDKTAAVNYLFSPFLSRLALPLDQVCEIAHRYHVPVIVDAASFIPPRANLRRFIAEGADLVIYSGGKGVRGPQGTGILCGRSDLIEAAMANASPNPFLGRGMKVSKEEIIGLITALEIFVKEDEQAETDRYYAMGQAVTDALENIPGLEVRVKHDSHDYLIPTALIHFLPDYPGPSRNEVLHIMAQGDPPIFLHSLGNPDDLAVDPLNVSEEELVVVIDRLKDVLSGR